jgi:hypothetical protein
VKEILRIGNALYKVDYQTKTYWFHGRGAGKISLEEEERNKRKIDGFTRILRDGKNKRFRFKR